MHVLIVTREFDNNATGRAFALWMLAQALGYTTTVVPAGPGDMWGPLRSEARFVADCRTSAPRWHSWLDDARRADVILAVKPLPATFGLARRLALASGRPLLVDIDDPDLEERLRSDSPWREAPGWMRERARLHRARRRLRNVSVMVSNPTLQSWYGGTLVPHVRIPSVAGQQHVSTKPTVAFVGTPNPHKGVAILREAVRRLAPAGYRLIITADRPRQAHAHETWVGQTDLERGLDLVRSSDIVALPSLPTGYGEAQLPVKLVDAMLAARAVVVSDLPPLMWAAAGCSVVVPPGSVDALADALRGLADPLRRQSLGDAARHRALERFTVGAVAPAFSRALASARPLAVRDRLRI